MPGGEISGGTSVYPTLPNPAQFGSSSSMFFNNPYNTNNNNYENNVNALNSVNSLQSLSGLQSLGLLNTDGSNNNNNNLRILNESIQSLDLWTKGQQQNPTLNDVWSSLSHSPTQACQVGWTFYI